MTIKEYADLLEYIKQKLNNSTDVKIHNINSNYDPVDDRVYSVNIKYGTGNYFAKNNNGAIYKEELEDRNFFYDECNVEIIKEWIDDFMLKE